MKTIKYILLATASVSLLLLTGCTTTQNIPYDDVYYSTSNESPQSMMPQNTYSSNFGHKSKYKLGKLEAVNMGSQNSAQNQNTNNQKANPDNNNKRNIHAYTIQNDTVVKSNKKTNIYNNISVGLGFNSPYFGSGISSWSLGGYQRLFGFGTFGVDPFWNNYYSPYYYSPYYSWFPYDYYGGWGGYFGWGNSFWGLGWGYPYYYGYYSSYYDGNPYYGYNTYLYNHSMLYGHRDTKMDGSLLSRGGGMYYNEKSSKARAAQNSGIRPTVLPGSKAGIVTSRRPIGSMRYQKALANERANHINNSIRSQKSAYRGNSGLALPSRRNQSFGGFNIPSRRFQRPNGYRQEKNMSRPRYQKPKQYQSLDSRQPRSSKEYFRLQPQAHFYNRATRRVEYNNVRQPAHRFNIYRPHTSRSYNARPVYRNSRARPQRYNSTRQYSSPQFYSAPSNNNRRIYSAPTRGFSRPMGGSPDSGGGGGSRGSGGGGSGIRR